MRVHLLGHGSAEDAPPSGSDSSRRLTTAGREEVRRTIDCALRAKLKPSLILSSPYVRAVQTAEISAAVLGYTGDIVQTPALVPEGPPEDVWEEIRSRKTESQILLTGHEPLLSRLTAFLLNCPTLQIDMRKATLVSFELDHFDAHPRGILKSVISPDNSGN